MPQALGYISQVGKGQEGLDYNGKYKTWRVSVKCVFQAAKRAYNDATGKHQVGT